MYREKTLEEKGEKKKMVRKEIKIKAGVDLWISVLNEDGTHKTSINIDNRGKTAVFYFKDGKIESCYPSGTKIVNNKIVEA